MEKCTPEELDKIEAACLKEFETVKEWEVANFEELKEPGYKFFGDTAVFLPQFPAELMEGIQANILTSLEGILGSKRGQEVYPEVKSRFAGFLSFGPKARLLGASDYSEDDVLVRVHFLNNRESMYLDQNGNAMVTTLGGDASPMSRNSTRARYKHLFQPVPKE